MDLGCELSTTRLSSTSASLALHAINKFLDSIRPFPSQVAEELELPASVNVR